MTVFVMTSAYLFFQWILQNYIPQTLQLNPLSFEFQPFYFKNSRNVINRVLDSTGKGYWFIFILIILFFLIHK